MQKFVVHQGLVAPMDRENVDTDAIIPKQFLKSIRKTGFEDALFHEWRKDPEFVLNQEPFRASEILVGDTNFGCGSSREAAVYVLVDRGIRAVIAPSFGDIFFSNALKNGLLPIVLPESQVAQLFDEVFAFPGYTLTIDLERQCVVKPDGTELAFEVQAFRKFCLLNGLDDIGLTLQKKDKIKAFEAERLATKPWLAKTALV